MLDQYYDYIKRVCRGFDKNNHQDLAHDIIILLYEQKNKCEYLIKKGIFKGWLYVVIKNQFIDLKRKNRECPLFENHQLQYSESTNPTKEVNDLISEADLTYTERMWIETFIEHDLNSTWVSNSIKVSRQCASRNYNKALNKLKQAI